MLCNIVADLEMITFLLKGGLHSFINYLMKEFERWKALLEEDGYNTKSMVLNDLQIYIKQLKEVLKNGTN